MWFKWAHNHSKRSPELRKRICWTWAFFRLFTAYFECKKRWPEHWEGIISTRGAKNTHFKPEASENSAYSSRDERYKKSDFKFEFYVKFCSRNTEIVEIRQCTGLFQRYYWIWAFFLGLWNTRFSRFSSTWIYFNATAQGADIWVCLYTVTRVHIPGFSACISNKKMLDMSFQVLAQFFGVQREKIPRGDFSKLSGEAII